MKSKSSGRLKTDLAEGQNSGKKLADCRVYTPRRWNEKLLHYGLKIPSPRRLRFGGGWQWGPFAATASTGFNERRPSTGIFQFDTV
ncbi:hypothetical protein SV7mr_42680 [Stieleria bergensis]|uniref:Uncharacterized protein n=1 Tax=Stieleria bergensis TaxID=2528025 RepID=A0A517T009_9BACT|nr:hypothetical protein SV7mr_42680 [Planctomycetes bacterium SV_7m_r]